MIPISAVVRTSAYAKVAVTAAGTIVKKSFEGILVGLFGMEVAEAAGKDSCDCEPRPKKHRGGNEAHNQCADSYSKAPPFIGNDVIVAGKYFDAFDGTKSPPGTLFEVKTGTAYTRGKNTRADGYAKDKYLKFLRSKAVYEYYWDLVIARGCGFEFNFVTKDTDLSDAMEDFFREKGREVDAARIIGGGCQ